MYPASVYVMGRERVHARVFPCPVQRDRRAAIGGASAGRMRGRPQPLESSLEATPLLGLRVLGFLGQDRRAWAEGTAGSGGESLGLEK